MTDTDAYPSIGEYAFISDCHSVALVARSGSIDWCCMPRLDSGSTFGRILDWERGGFCSIRPSAAHEGQRAYLEVEAAPLGDRAHVQRQRSTRDDDALHAGNES